MKATPTTSDVIGQLRFPLIILVTYAHSYGSIAPDYQLLSSDWNSYELLKLLVSQTLAKTAVPLFFVFSSYLFFLDSSRWNGQIYIRKMRRRCLSLLIPYLLWNLLAALKYGAALPRSLWIDNPQAGLQTDWLGQQQWLTTPANMPLWFLRDLIVVSLLSPVLYAALRGQWGKWVMAVLTVAYLSGIQAFTPGLSAYAVYFFSLGSWLSLHRHDLVETSLRMERPAYAAFLTLALLMMASYHTPVFSSLMLCFRWVSVPALVCLCYRILCSTPMRQPHWLGDASYFVYLSHFVLFFSIIDTWFFRLFGSSSLSLSFHYLLCPLLKIVILCAIYRTWRLIRHG